MLAYLTLIIEAHMECEGEAWLGYDRRFRQRAAAYPGMSWAMTDHTLWSLAFSDRAKALRCKHCFSLTHASVNYEWTSTPDTGDQSSCLQLGTYALIGIRISAQAVHVLTAPTNMFVLTVLRIPPSSTNFVNLSSALTLQKSRRQAATYMEAARPTVL